MKPNTRRTRRSIAPDNPLGYSDAMDSVPLVTVIETSGYINRSAKLLTEAKKTAVVDYLATNPAAGDLIPGGGGVRKLRWGAEGRGKRGGVRIIYFFADTRFPVFLLDIFAKNEAENYTAAELAQVRVIAKALIDGFRSGEIKDERSRKTAD